MSSTSNIHGIWFYFKQSFTYTLKSTTFSDSETFNHGSYVSVTMVYLIPSLLYWPLSLAMLRACPNMTLAAERDIKALLKFWTF